MEAGKGRAIGTGMEDGMEARAAARVEIEEAGIKEREEGREAETGARGETVAGTGMVGRVVGRAAEIAAKGGATMLRSPTSHRRK